MTLFIYSKVCFAFYVVRHLHSGSFVLHAYGYVVFLKYLNVVFIVKNGHT